MRWSKIYLTGVQYKSYKVATPLNHHCCTRPFYHTWRCQVFLWRTIPSERLVADSSRKANKLIRNQETVVDRRGFQLSGAFQSSQVKRKMRTFLDHGSSRVVNRVASGPSNRGSNPSFCREPLRSLETGD